MNRRTLGLVVLLLTAVVAVVVPRAVSGIRITGTPVAFPVPAAPQVGQCVLSDPNLAGAGFGQLPVPTYGSCATRHFGEVVQVFTDFRSFPSVELAQIPTPDPASCTLPANSYLGAVQVLAGNDRGDYLNVGFGDWQPVSIGTVGLFGPSPVQQRTGQHWIACTTQSPGGAAYMGTVRNAFIGGTLPDPYTVCADRLNSRSRIDCATGHLAEVFATTPMTNSLPTATALRSSCEGFVRYLTGRKDLAASGRLEVQISAMYYDMAGDPVGGFPFDPKHQPAQAFCGVVTTGSSVLTATVFALGNRPLPLS